MGNIFSLGNSIIFPAPPPSYTSQLYELIWIPKRFGYDKNGDRKTTPGSFPVLYLPSPLPSSVIMIYLHGNSCDIGQVMPELRLISHELNVSFMAVEYPGYGVSPEVSVATGELIDCRVRATFKFLLSLGVDPRNIIFFGRSIGTGPAAALAAEFKQQGIQCGGVILQAPYISIHRIIEDYFAIGTWLVTDFWNTEVSLQKMGPTTPLLLIHGLLDEIIPVYHGKTLYECYKSDLKLADFQPTAKHNMYSIIDDLCVPIGKFLSSISLTRNAPIVDLKLPQWCLYSCNKLVNGQTILERNRKTALHHLHEKQINSARLPDNRVRGRLTRHYSVTHDPTYISNSRSYASSPMVMRSIDTSHNEECPVSSIDQQPIPRHVHRTASKASFQSSLQDLCDSNALNSEDISEFVTEAIARTTQQ
ncbi:hypothetical protein X943_003420 [Babesia divergens]|uniref:Serine aminopeptidase S33 domain-containing protein n=1 Tax=Babesia divergens TaxID=32595 RepID=A0AAD9LEE5_BABDI|nr:hypothetical protein X943_003420 [Babesia divergens]